MKELAEQVMEQAKICDVTIVTAESCTAGALANLLSQAPGAGDHLEGGFVTYTKDMKKDALGVSMRLLKAKSAVCEEVAKAMAIGALKRSPADVAIAITGVAGPEPDEDGNPVGLVYIAAIRVGGRTIATRHMFENKSREDILQLAIEQALLALRQICSQ